MISLHEVSIIHNILIEKFGGAKGIRDQAILESAINRPYHGFDNYELYPDRIDKASAIFESIVTNHPFVDGNKRTGYVLMRLLLMEGKLDIIATEDNKYDFVISTAKGELKFDQIRDWIQKRITNINS